MSIQPWRERAGRSPDYQLTCPSAVEKAMEAEKHHYPSHWLRVPELPATEAKGGAA